MKVRGLIRDVTGASRVTRARRNLIASGSSENHYSDPIRELAEEVHPEVTRVRVVKVEDVSMTARMFTFEACEGDKLPPFQAGQYCSLDLKINGTITTRPYSICSAPYQARQNDHPFFALTIRNGKPNEGFASSWLYEHVKPGDEFSAHLPFGQFYYEPLRDAKHLIALAGGSGGYHPGTAACCSGRTVFPGQVHQRDLRRTGLRRRKGLSECRSDPEIQRIRRLHVLCLRPAADVSVCFRGAEEAGNSGTENPL